MVLFERSQWYMVCSHRIRDTSDWNFLIFAAGHFGQAHYSKTLSCRDMRIAPVKSASQKKTSPSDLSYNWWFIVPSRGWSHIECPISRLILNRDIRLGLNVICVSSVSRNLIVCRCAENDRLYLTIHIHVFLLSWRKELVLINNISKLILRKNSLYYSASFGIFNFLKFCRRCTFTRWLQK